MSGRTLVERHLNSRLDQAKAFAMFLIVVIPLFGLFFATSSRERPHHIDPFTNVIPAWKLGDHGTVYFNEYVQLTGPEQHN